VRAGAAALACALECAGWRAVANGAGAGSSQLRAAGAAAHAGAFELGAAAAAARVGASARRPSAAAARVGASVPRAWGRLSNSAKVANNGASNLDSPVGVVE